MAFAETSLTALTLNTHLWGETGLVGTRETGLYFRDNDRVGPITDRLRDIGAHLVGLQEVFSPTLQRRMSHRLSDIYPYCVMTPGEGGVSQAIDYVQSKWPRLAGRLFRKPEDVVDLFAKTHYEDGWMQKFMRRYVSEDGVARTLHQLVDGQHFWGSGLLFLSQHPILDSQFIPHPVSADLERFAHKGVLKAVVQPPHQPAVTVLVTHLQEGETPHAIQARQKQIRQLQIMGAAIQGPLIVMGDLNVDEIWVDQYASLAGELSEIGAFDCFRFLYPDRTRYRGSTYKGVNPFETKLVGKRSPTTSRDQRLDYHFARGFQAVMSRVLEGEFPGLSDHEAVATQLVSTA